MLAIATQSAIFTTSTNAIEEHKMSYAPTNTIKRVIGTFKNKEHGTSFDYEANTPNDSWLPIVDYPHRVWVSSFFEDSGWRYANVKKTVAYIVLDEDEYGQPVIEKWSIKNHITYR